MARRQNRQRGEGAIKAIIALAVLIIAGIAGFKIVPLHLAGNDVMDAMDEAANFAGLKPLDKLQWDIFQRAQKAGAPLPLNEIKISRQGSSVRISAKYEQTVNVLGYNYRYIFDRSVEKPVF